MGSPSNVTSCGFVQRPRDSTFPANRNCGLEHLALALLQLEEGLRQISRIKLRVAGGRADIRMAEEELRQP
jgi:hypothetical protein